MPALAKAGGGNPARGVSISPGMGAQVMKRIANGRDRLNSAVPAWDEESGAPASAWGRREVRCTRITFRFRRLE